MNLDEKQTGFYLAYLKYKKEKQIKSARASITEQGQIQRKLLQ